MADPDPLAMVVEFRALPGREADLRSDLLALVAPTRAEDGCLRYDLHDDPQDPARFAFYEVWASPDHHRAHDATDHVAAIVAALPELAEGGAPSRITRWRPLEP
jgi:quinol monooxygenase YgiN